MRDFDELLDAVLNEDAGVEPRPGLERRILAVVRAEASRKRWLRMWWVPAGACLGLALGVVLMMQHGRSGRVDSRTADVKAADSHPAVGGRAAELKDVRPHREMRRGGASRVARRSSASRVMRTDEVGEARLPKMKTFPAVAQSGGFLPQPESDGGAKVLREVVDSPQVAQALEDLKSEQERLLEVSAIEIQPL